MEPPLVHVIQGIDFSCLVMVCSTTFVLIRLLGDMLLVIVNNSFFFIRTAQFEHTVLITDTGVEVLTVDTED